MTMKTKFGWYEYFSCPTFLICLMLCFVAVLQGCATSSGVQEAFDPAIQARIRVFHGTAAYLYLGDVRDNHAHQVIHAANGGFSYLVPNKRIGMPATDDMPFSYNEYIVPANKSLTVKMYWQAQNASRTWEHCGPLYTTFTPQSGQDYDTFMKFDHGVCQGVKVRQLVSDGKGKTVPRPALLDRLPFRYCG